MSSPGRLTSLRCIRVITASHDRQTTCLPPIPRKDLHFPFVYMSVTPRFRAYHIKERAFWLASHVNPSLTWSGSRHLSFWSVSSTRVQQDYLTSRCAYRSQGRCRVEYPREATQCSAPATQCNPHSTLRDACAVSSHRPNTFDHRRRHQ